ncbi:MAG: GNAT family N-acetyltransferase [Ruthenibacterium sp.]
MIAQITPEQVPWANALLAQDDFIGMRIASAVRCYGFSSQNCRFYAVEDTAVLMTRGDGALLCGAVCDVEELESFLHFAKIRALVANQTMLYHWNPAPRLLMKHSGATELLYSAPIETQPDLWALAHSDLLGDLPPDAWYADVCLCVNRGEAAIVTIETDGAPVATAGLYAIGEKSAYLSAVATQKAFRGRGFATTLVSALCASVPEQSVYLLCTPALRRFYEQLGFTLVKPLCEFQTLEK